VMRSRSVMNACSVYVSVVAILGLLYSTGVSGRPPHSVHEPS